MHEQTHMGAILLLWKPSCYTLFKNTVFSPRSNTGKINSVHLLETQFVHHDNFLEINEHPWALSFPNEF